jgi:hypothetical protein
LLIDDVDRAAGAVAARLRQIERFLHHALAGNRSVAVYEHRQHLVDASVGARCCRARTGAFDDGSTISRCDGLKRQRQVHRARPASPRRMKSPGGI